MIITDLTDPLFTNLFTTFKYTAFRLNSREEYRVDEETSAYEAFKRHGTVTADELGFMHQWVEQVVTPAVQAGKRMSRVQIWRTDGTVAEDGTPGGLSDYHRFQREAFKISSAAGEQIRIITTSPGSWPTDVCLPTIPVDFWLFDSSHMLEMHFDEDNTFREAHLNTELTSPSAIVRANLWRDAAIAQSKPFYP